MQKVVFCAVNARALLNIVIVTCPYCGNITEHCRCNLENSKGSDKILSTLHYSKLDPWNKSKEPSLVNTHDDDWWRLEKWQIGRRNFP